MVHQSVTFLDFGRSSRLKRLTSTSFVTNIAAPVFILLVQLENSSLGISVPAENLPQFHICVSCGVTRLHAEPNTHSLQNLVGQLC